MSSELFDLRGDGTAVVRLHVQPGSGRTAVVGRHGDALKVKVAAPPEGGRANDACLALVASVLGRPSSDVELASGASSRSKRVVVKGLERDELVRLLDLAIEEAASAVRRNSPRPSMY